MLNRKHQLLEFGYRTLDYWIVLGVALATRLLFIILSPGALYFPDSWCYITIQPSSSAPCVSGHPNVVTFLWHLGTLGRMTQGNVLTLQSIVGVATVLIVFRVMHGLTRRSIALGFAIAYAMCPLQLFAERTMMTETFESFFVALALLFLVVAVKKGKPTRTWTAVWLTSFCFGVAAAIHTAFELPALLGVALLVTFATIRQVRHRRGRNIRSFLGACLLSLVVVSAGVLPSVPATIRFHHFFGGWTQVPLESALLVERWSPLISCATTQDMSKVARTIIASACKRSHFTNPPGSLLEHVYSGQVDLLLTEAPRPADFWRTETALHSALIRGMEGHPISWSVEMLRSMVWQVVEVPTYPYNSYLNARRSGGTLVRAKPDWFTNYNLWFSGTQPKVNEPAAGSLSNLASYVDWTPLALFWLAVLGLIRYVITRRRNRKAQPEVAQGKEVTVAPLDGLDTSRVILLGIGWTLLLASLVSVAFSTEPSTRMWIPLLPILLVLCVLGCPQYPRVMQESKVDD